MNSVERSTLSAKALALREVFDAGFAAPPPPLASPATALLLIRVGDELLAVKRAEMTGLARVESIAPAPGRSPSFLGLAGLRGELFPVWSLAGLLGRALTTDATTSRWLVLAAARADAPCAFACDGFERLVFVPDTEMIACTERDRRHEHMQAVAPWDSLLISVINLPALQAEIHKRKDSTQPPISPP